MTSKDLQLFKLTNKEGTVLEILNLGASIFSLKMKSAKGDLVNVVVGPKHKVDYLSEAYLNENMCFGASIGRYAGRISNGKFQLKDHQYKLYEKDGVHLHGGQRGLQHKIWELKSESSRNNPSLVLSCDSKDGDEGYPGNLHVEVCYTLTENNELKIEYSATCDQETILNLTNHTYFNLNGSGSVLEHNLQINASNILDVDEKLLPTGIINDLNNEPKNFIESKKIQNILVDDTFILDKNINVAARVYAPQSQIEMVLTTNQPAVVTFIPERLPTQWSYNTNISKEFPSICLEAQNFPDAPNNANFPSAILAAGETYFNAISFKFAIKAD